MSNKLNHLPLQEDRKLSEMDSFLDSQSMGVLQENRLLEKNSENLRVLLCFYSNNEWIPVTLCPLVDAMTIYRKGKVLGTEFFVFSVKSNPQGLN